MSTLPLMVAQSWGRQLVLQLEYIASFVKVKVQEWVAELDKLSQFADSQPHAAYIFCADSWSLQ